METVVVINLMLAGAALLKDIFLASYLGTSVQADAFWLAFFYPDTVGNNLLANSLAIACVPVFTRLYAADDPSRVQAVTHITLFFVSGALLLFLVSFLARVAIVSRLGTGLDANTLVLSVKLFVVMLPLVAIVSLGSIGTAVMQVHHRFVIPALSPVLFNVVFLAAALYAYLRPVPVQEGVYLLAFAVLAGTVSMVMLIWSALGKYRIKIWMRPRLAELSRSWGDMRELLRLFLPHFCILMSSQAVYSVERYLASHLETGSIAGLNYAFRIAQFPSWVFVAAVSTVAFPAMSRAAGMGQFDRLRDIVHRSMLLVMIIAFPLAMSLFILRLPVVAILFQRGSFDAGSVQITAGILAGYALTIVSQAVSLICLRAFFAIGRVLTALLVVLFAALSNIALDYYLVGSFGSAGLGYGAAVGAAINALLLTGLLIGTLRIGSGDGYRDGWLRILAANLTLLPVVGLFSRVWLLVRTDSGSFSRMEYVFAVLAVCLPVYWLALKFFRVIPLPAGDLHQ